MIRRLHKYMAEYGTLDEQNRGRDLVDDKHVNHLGQSIFIYTIFRTLAPFMLAWRGDMTNVFEGLSWATPLKIGWWEIALDYWFYLYHRSCHEYDFLWFIHRQHHATKHPTPSSPSSQRTTRRCSRSSSSPSSQPPSRPR